MIAAVDCHYRTNTAMAGMVSKGKRVKELMQTSARTALSVIGFDKRLDA